MQRRGFTIIESMLASTVLAVAVLGISSALAVTHQQNQTLRDQAILLRLAQSLAEEIAATPYTDSLGGFGGGFAAGNTDRRTYNDVFDFAGYTDQSPFASAMPSGATVDYAGQYRRAVTVEPLATPSTVAASAAVSKFARITVTASGPSGRKVELRRWVARFDVER